MYNKGFFIADVGVIGVYTLFGIFYVIGWIIIYFRLIKTPSSQQYVYVKYFFLCSISGAIIGGSLYEPTSVISCIFALYIFQKHLDEQKRKLLSIKLLSILQSFQKNQVDKVRV